MTLQRPFRSSNAREGTASSASMDMLFFGGHFNDTSIVMQSDERRHPYLFARLAPSQAEIDDHWAGNMKAP